MKAQRKAVVLGTGFNVPDNVVTNDDLAKIVDTSDEWIRSRTGIVERRQIPDDDSLFQLSLPAARQAIENAGITPEDIDLIIFSTFTPDYQVPATACMVQAALGCTKAGAFDLQAACTGFIYGSSIACQFIATGTYKHVLVIGGDVTTRISDFTDRNSCVLFGDGVGAAVYGPGDNDDEGVFDNLLGAIGSGAEYIMIKNGGSMHRPTVEAIQNREHYLTINGKEVFKFSTKIVGDMIEEVLTRNNLTLDDVAMIIPHQANIRIIESAAKRFKCPIEKFYVNIDRYGNTVAATIPIAMHEALKEGKIKKGDIVLLVGFGGGLTYGIIPIKWGSYTNPKV
ncbi:MAG: 3-oxoacyl-[acyl-carrier-protein] synthase [Clostridiales bacterium]|jgi:3-oxoacyl-[acyl-carrier-protein] synthase-3|nr:3-oxoacyl-[acyl-carrier-protein] synthase [Clostridiales bacterium]MDN5282395.1 3-oxoacyl-[acyl-carrier-protein] synthase [Candidatus Ozemobacter sp.]